MDFDLAKQASEARLKREALAEIERMRRIDEWIPSYRNVHTRAALRGLVDLMQMKIIPRRTTSFLPYTRPGNHDEVRLEAFDHLLNLGMMTNDAFIQYIFSSLSNEPSAYFRDRMWRRIHRGLASIALGDTKFEEANGEVEMDGLILDSGASMIASRADAMDRSTVDGALKAMRIQLGNNEALEGAIMDALRYESPVIPFDLILNTNVIADRPSLASKTLPNCWTFARTSTIRKTSSWLRYAIHDIGVYNTWAKAECAFTTQTSIALSHSFLFHDQCR